VCTLISILFILILATTASAAVSFWSIPGTFGHPSPYVIGVWTYSFGTATNSSPNTQFWDMPLALTDAGSHDIYATWGSPSANGPIACAQAFALTNTGAFAGSSSSQQCHAIMQKTSSGRYQFQPTVERPLSSSVFPVLLVVSLHQSEM
jgi:hypothetical protein